ncbi:MAG: WD40 repeat domain-containing protein [Archangium sp.]|nr:WD40 repeat domain-containing protein [Archangium sp.]
MRWRSDTVKLPGVEAPVRHPTASPQGALPLAGICAASSADRVRIFTATHDGAIRGVDLETQEVFFSAQLDFELPSRERQLAEHFGVRDAATLVASSDGRFLAVVQRFGLQGALFDVQTQKLLKPLVRDDYHAEVSAWCIAIVDDVLVYASAWNRIEAWSISRLERIAPTDAETTLNYFWGHASVSPSGRYLASFGWHWHPIGVVRLIDLHAWLREGGEPKPEPIDVAADWWDDELCWIDEDTLVLAGDERDDESYFDKQTGLAFISRSDSKMVRFIKDLVPRALGVHGARLVALGKETQVVDHDATLLHETHFWHPGARVALTFHAHGSELVMHRLLGVDARGDLPAQPTRENLLVLADALEARGASADAIAHCRAGEAHASRCWVLDACAE